MEGKLGRAQEERKFQWSRMRARTKQFHVGKVDKHQTPERHIRKVGFKTGKISIDTGVQDEVR